MSSSFTGSSVKDWEFKTEGKKVLRWMPEARPLKIRLNNSVNHGTPVTLSLNYEGTITDYPAWSANVMETSWVEAGIYFPWFPHNLQYSPFTYNVTATYPKHFYSAGSGNTSITDGTYILKSQKPSMDIVIVLSDTFHTTHRENNLFSINVHTVLLSKKTAQLILNDMSWMLDTFNSWFGKVPADTITLVESRRTKGGGYSHDGFISLAGLSDTGYTEKHENYIRYLSHESSHLWWHHAPADNWEDWLNEGFAEYTAMLAVREKFGESAFNALVSKKTDIIKNTPPVWQFNRSDNSLAQKVLYNKAPLILHMLAEKIGQPQFLELLKATHGQSISSTDTFLQILESLEGKTTRQWFEALLHKREIVLKAKE